MAATTATFTGTVGHTYSFYSVATDNVGNVEATPVSAEATTTVPYFRGDANLDGHVNAADLLPMMMALTNLSGYQTSNGLSTTDLETILDVNQDGHINNADLQALLNMLLSGGGSSSPAVSRTTITPTPMVDAVSESQSSEGISSNSPTILPQSELVSSPVNLVQTISSPIALASGALTENNIPATAFVDEAAASGTPESLSNACPLAAEPIASSEPTVESESPAQVGAVSSNSEHSPTVANHELVHDSHFISLTSSQAMTDMIWFDNQIHDNAYVVQGIGPNTIPMTLPVPLAATDDFYAKLTNPGAIQSDMSVGMPDLLESEGVDGFWNASLNGDLTLTI
jgi:hypothetical protein